jgi:hypothetical protein
MRGPRSPLSQAPERGGGRNGSGVGAETSYPDLRPRRVLRAHASKSARAQMLSPALAEIIGARRLWTVSMISAVSMPSR